MYKNFVACCSMKTAGWVGKHSSVPPILSSPAGRLRGQVWAYRLHTCKQRDWDFNNVIQRSWIGVSRGPLCPATHGLTDEQPGLCAEPRGPRSLDGEEEEETVGGFMGVLAVTVAGLCSHLLKAGGAEGGGRGGGDVAVTVLWPRNSGSRQGLRSCVKSALAKSLLADGHPLLCLLNLLFVPAVHPPPYLCTCIWPLLKTQTVCWSWCR